MAGFLELIDNTLGTDFDAPRYDASKGRRKMVAIISKAAEQHKEGKTPPTRSWKLGSNNAIRFSPKINGTSVLIAGEADNYVQAERFQDFLAALKAAVEAGDLDEEIKAALGGEQGTIPRMRSIIGGREVTPEGRVNIAMNNRYYKDLSDKEVEAKLIEKGHDPAIVKAAIKTRKKG